MGFLMPRHPLTNFEIQRYYQNELRFNGAFSRYTFFEYEQTIQQCVGNFALDSLILYLQVTN